jgi:hypothetical protein
VSILYTVTCRIDTPENETRWLGWLEREHIADVVAAGAESAEICRRLDAERTYDIHYRFANRDAYEAYIKHHAPRLREQGAKIFPPGDSFAYSRAAGEIIFSR